jgi:hypothetical protein
MGNVSSIRDDDRAGGDEEFLNLHGSAYFSSDYVRSIYDKLPKYEGTEVTSAASNAPHNAMEDNIVDRKTIDLMSLFSKSEVGGCISESTQLRSLGDNSLQSAELLESIKMNKMRLRLFLRTYRAYMRKTVSGLASDPISTSFIRIPLRASKSEAATPPTVALSAITATMCISIAKSVGKESKCWRCFRFPLLPRLIASFF